MVIIKTRLLRQLDNIFLPIGVTIHFFFTRPGRFRARDLHFGKLIALFIDKPDFFIDSSQGPAFNAVLNRPGSAAQRGANTK